MQYERYIFIALIVVLWLGVLDTPISFVSSLVISAMDFVTKPVDWLIAIIVR